MAIRVTLTPSRMLPSATYLCIDLGNWINGTTICTYDSTGARTHVEGAHRGIGLGETIQWMVECIRDTRADKIGILAGVSTSLEEDFKQGLLGLCDNPLPDVRLVALAPAQMRGKSDVERCDMLVRELMSHA
jgi:hypothetical protein